MSDRPNFTPAVPLPSMGSSPADYIRTIRKIHSQTAHLRMTRDCLLKQAEADGLNRHAIKAAATLAYRPTDTIVDVVKYLTEWSEDR